MKIKGIIIFIFIILLAVGCSPKSDDSNQVTTSHQDEEKSLEYNELQKEDEQKKLEGQDNVDTSDLVSLSSEAVDTKSKLKQKYSMSEVEKNINLIVSESLYVLGGSIDGNWINSDELYELNIGEKVYKLYSFLGKLGEVQGSEPVLEKEPIEYLHVDMKNENSKYDYEIEKVFEKLDWLSYKIAVSGNWNALPREPRLQSSNIDTYSKIIKEILSNNKMNDAPVKILQNIKIDLEGDGIDEVIISASNISFDKDNIHKSGAYSLVVLLKIINSEVQNLTLAESYYPDDQEYYNGVQYRYLVPFVLDCNGDGIMEIIVEGLYYEGEWMEVFEIQNNEIHRVLVNGVGL